MARDWPKRLAEQDAHLQRLREELNAARVQYDAADHEFKRLTQVAKDVGVSSADGVHALHLAEFHFRVALQKYADVVKRYTACVLGDENRGRPPHEK